MAITTRTAWQRDGSPWKRARPITDLTTTLQGHGYTIGVLGDDRHLDAVPPEDHTPYSQTGWPGVSPYPYVLALDIESAPPGMPSTSAVGGQIVADKLAGKPGTQPIKYVNWTDPKGNTWHDQWMPGHSRTPSADHGHTHVSIRTDFYLSTVTGSYDPVATLQGDDMTPKEFLTLLNDPAVIDYMRRVSHQYKGSNAPVGARDEWAILNDMAKQVAALTVTPPPPVVPGSLTADDIRAVVREELAKLNLSLGAD